MSVWWVWQERRWCSITNSKVVSTKGLSVIELIISLAVLALVLAGVAGSLGTVFGSTVKSNNTANANSQIRDVMEQVRSQWGIRSGYDSNCVAVSVPSGHTMDFVLTTISATGTETTATMARVNAGSTCSNANNTADFKRITATLSKSEKVVAQLTLEMARPAN